jgi:hypothetical protein
LQAGPAALGESGRDTAPERVAVRQLAATVIKAARDLVGSDSHKPCMRTPAVAARRCSRLVAIRPSSADAAPAAPALLRAEMLDLPPPARRA